MSTHNLCFEQKYEKNIRIFIWKFTLFLGGKIFRILNRRVFVIDRKENVLGIDFGTYILYILGFLMMLCLHWVKKDYDVIWLDVFAVKTKTIVPLKLMMSLR